MSASIFALLAIVVLGSFFVFIFFSREHKNKVYVKFVLLAFPLLAIDLFPSVVSITIFDFITFVYFFVFYKPRKKQVENAGLYLLLFFVLTTFILFGAYQADGLTRDTTTAFIQFFSIACFVKIVSEECISDNKFFHSVVLCLKITLILSLLFLAGQFVFGTSFSIARSQNINVYGGLSTRYPSFFQDPQKYAQFLAAVSFLFLIKDRHTSKISLNNYLLLLCTLIAIMFTGGRAAFGGWCVGVFIVLVFGGSKYRVATTFVASLLFVIVYNFSESFAMFQRADLTESYEFRYAIWQDAFRIFKEHPLFGIGIGNYANYVSVHNPDQYWLAENEFTYFDHPESGYLKFLTELGAIGFLLILFFILFPILTGFKKYLKNKNTTILLLIAALTSWMIGFYTVYSLGDSRIKILVVTIICLLVSNNKSDVEYDNKRIFTPINETAKG
jgi:O-antigen ligase